MVIFDTSLLVDALIGKRKAIEAIESYRNLENGWVAAISKYELLSGKKFSEQRSMEELFDILSVYDFGDKEAKVSAEIYKALKSSGRLIEEADIMIAGTAIANNEKLVTEDAGFNAIRKLGYANIVVV